MTREIRALTMADAEAVHCLILMAFAAQGVVTDPPSGALRETGASIAAQIGGGGGIGVVEDGQWVAAVLWAEQDADALHLGRLAVRPDARRQGLARLLVAAVEAEALRRGKRRVTLGVRLALEDNRRLFASCGYAEIGRTSHPGHARPTSATLEKRLVAA